MEDAETIAYLANIVTAHKSFDASPEWVSRPVRDGVRLDLAVAVRLDGVLGGGVSILLSTPETAWERDLYGQITVRLPQKRKSLRLCPIEWRPLRDHRNPGDAPEELRFAVLRDRWHPFPLNRDRSPAVFTQDLPGVAVPLPRAITSFSEYIHLCAELWNCPDMAGVPPPPWARVLL